MVSANLRHFFFWTLIFLTQKRRNTSRVDAPLYISTLGARQKYLKRIKNIRNKYTGNTPDGMPNISVLNTCNGFRNVFTETVFITKKFSNYSTRWIHFLCLCKIELCITFFLNYVYKESFINATFSRFNNEFKNILRSSRGHYLQWKI